MKIAYLISPILAMALLALAWRISVRHDQTFTFQSGDIALSHTAYAENFGDGPILTVGSVIHDNISAKVWYTENSDGREYKTLDMEPARGGLFIRLKPLAAGKSYLYHIDVFRDNVRLATFPPSGDESINFRGHTSRVVLALHVLFMYSAILSGLMAVFTSIDLARRRVEIRRAVQYIPMTFISAFLSAIPFGMILSAQAYGGSGWHGWPFGSSSTDTKSEILLLFWLITMILSWGGLRGRKMAISNGVYSFLTMLSFMVTTITLLIPHSI